MSDSDLQRLQNVLSAVPELPVRVLETYARLWQLEIWLRQMVYVELKALLGDEWDAKVVKSGRAEHSRQSDMYLSYMPTPEKELISYATFSDLCQTICNEWNLFQPHLLPKELWKAKLEEIKQIRNRVAHFRSGHTDDLQRVIQLLRDIDNGFWRFCTSYNASRPILPPSADPVALHFLHLEQFPYAEVGDNTWARVGIADPAARFNLTIEKLRRPWQTPLEDGAIVGAPGYLYDVTITVRNQQAFDYRKYLQQTSTLHPKFVHICLDHFASDVRITIPAILGGDVIIQSIDTLVELVPYALRMPYRIDPDDKSVQVFADSWPEYVLGPDNPLTFLCPDMPGSFFGV